MIVFVFVKVLGTCHVSMCHCHCFVKVLGIHPVSLRCGNDCHCFVKVLGICHVSMCHCNCFVKVLGIHPVYLRCGNDYLCFCLSFRNMSHINVSL